MTTIPAIAGSATWLAKSSLPSEARLAMPVGGGFLALARLWSMGAACSRSSRESSCPRSDRRLTNRHQTHLSSFRWHCSADQLREGAKHMLWRMRTIFFRLIGAVNPDRMEAELSGPGDIPPVRRDKHGLAGWQVPLPCDHRINCSGRLEFAHGINGPDVVEDAAQVSRAHCCLEHCGGTVGQDAQFGAFCLEGSQRCEYLRIAIQTPVRIQELLTETLLVNPSFRHCEVERLLGQSPEILVVPYQGAYPGILKLLGSPDIR